MDYDVIVAGGGPQDSGWHVSSRLLVCVLRFWKGLPRPRSFKSSGSSSGYHGDASAGNPVPPFQNFAIFTIDLRRLDFPHPYGVIIPQARVEALLEERARELCAEIRRGHEVVWLHQETQGVTVQVRTESATHVLTAKYLVGCDGGHSVVRKELGVSNRQFNSHRYRQNRHAFSSSKLVHAPTCGGTTPRL